MASPSTPSTHDLLPRDVSVRVIPDQLTCVQLLSQHNDGPLMAGELYIAGDSDRERLNNLLEIAQRMRTAALDLLADLANNPGERSYTSTGEPPSFPEAAPLHGTTVTRVRTDAERDEEHRRIDEARRAQYPAPSAVTS